MRNISILLVLIFISFNSALYTQDTEPTPLRFNFIVNGDSITNQHLSRDYFPQTKFMLGTQWGGHSRMMKALKMNSNHAWQPHIDWEEPIVSPADPTDSMKYIWYGSDYYNCRAFQFKPTLYIPEYKRGEFVIQPADTTNSIFGFSYVRDTNQLFNEPSSTSYKLYRDSIQFLDSVVLQKVWLDDRYELFGNPLDSNYDITTGGTHWIFSINLRRLNSRELGSTNDTILSIRLPYRMKVDTTNYAYDTIRFSTKPKFSINDTVRLKYREDRGFALNDTATNQNYFVITNHMLPDNAFITNTGRQDITINAVFICDPNVTPFNPFVKNSTYPYINKLDVQIKYHGKRDVAINYCRISTPYGYDFLVGKQDSLIQDWYQKHINIIQNGGYEVFGFYGRDELPEEYFTEQHYKTRLFNFCTVSEGAGGEHPDHYNHYVQPMNIWIGAMNVKNDRAAPFYSKEYNGTDNQIQLYRLYYPKMCYNGWYSDTLNSGYETDLDKNNFVQWNFDLPIWKNVRLIDIDSMTLWPKWNPPTNILTGIDAYLYGLYYPQTFQGYVENRNYNAFYRNIHYLYSGEPWWAHNYPVGNWGVSNGYAHIGNTRPQTGEEVRWCLWTQTIFGAKGLMYDARCDSLRYTANVDSSSNDTGGFINNHHQKNKFDNMTLYDLIFTDDPAIGCDFIPEIDSSMFIHLNINRDTTAKYLGVPNDRIYYGRKSPKIEMYKIHSWIRVNDTLLMNLRLVSAFSKGIRIWRSADTARYTDTIMNKYIRLDNRMIIYDPNDTNKTLASDYGIKTRPIGRTMNGEPYYETYDSSFFDITLHRHKTDTALNSNALYLGIVNRRTDPLILWKDTVNSVPTQYMRFLASAEFEDSCQTGNRTWKFRDAYFKQLGSREITIPFNICNTEDPDRHLLIRVKELKSDDADTNKYWKQELMSRYIDTVISGTAELAVKLLPGEGKFLSVEILKPDTTFGHLAYSNQSKLISYPIYNQQGQETDSVRFHIAYHKPDSSGKMIVYYQRSKPVRRNSSNSNIIWESPINVSNGINASPIGFFSNWNCAYPSMVVRKDGTTPKAYIVFSCRDTMANTNDCGLCPDTCLRYYHPVCESVVSLANDGATLQTSTMIVRSTRGYYPENWLNADFSCPVISAGSQGNFYAWADSICGIGVGYKAPDQLILTNVSYTKKNGSGRASHPSLNVYPESNFSLNDCSLVWQEKTTGNSKIYYTKFKYANNNLTQFRPPFYNRNNDTALIFQLSDSFQDSKFPVIYRNLNNLEFGDTTNIQNEIIAWESAQSLKMNISLKSLLYFFYDNGNYSAGYIRPQNNINGCYNCMNHNYFYMPVLSQMSSYSNVMNSEPNLRYNLNFTKKINNDPMTVYHFEPAFYSLIASGNKIENYTFSDFRVADGTYPHLALSPVTNNVNIWKNRRVFEDGVSGNIPVIVPNSKYFYTVGEESCCPKTKFFGHKSGLNIFNISNLSVQPLGQNDYTLSFNLPYQEITDTVNGSFYIPVEQDTLYSDWFQVDSAATLSYLLNFNDSLSVTMRLQKQSTGEFTYLPVPFIPNSEFMNLVYFLVNGDNDYYRLAMLVRDSNAVYHESIVEDYLTQDTVFSKNGSSTSLINLRPERISEVGFYLEIRPNPATDVVNLTTYSESIQKVKYTVYNQQGIGILTLNGRTNQQYQINTKDFTTGIYIVKSEIESKIIKTSKLVIVK